MTTPPAEAHEASTIASSGVASSGIASSEEAAGGAVLESLLLALAEHESQFADRFYDLFFERRPDVVSLFGEYALAEREEMIRETFKSLVGELEGAPWLEENLHALGRSHAEYGVTRDMYPSFVDSMIDCTHEVLGISAGAPQITALRIALDAIVAPMASAGDEAAPTLPKAPS